MRMPAFVTMLLLMIPQLAATQNYDDILTRSDNAYFPKIAKFNFRHLIEINLPPSTPSELIIQDFHGNVILT